MAATVAIGGTGGAPGLRTPGAVSGGAGVGSFGDRLAAAGSPGASAREAAEEFVAMALVQPILAQLRETNAAAEPFAPGPVEKAFGPLMDAAAARRITSASGWGLVDRIESSLAGGSAALKEARHG